jgi:tRNA(Ser,Leu) C12 N-acetylase TAN1
VAFRTSNVIVTIEYIEQPATVGVVPDSKELQDRAQKLASQLADSLSD